MDSTFEPAARLFVGQDGVLQQVSSQAEMVQFLQGIPFKITTLYVLAHSRADAHLQFPVDGWVSPGTLAGSLKGAIPKGQEPAALDFRGCSIGMDPKGMNQLRTAVGASSVVGSTCFMHIFHGPSVTLGSNNEAITQRRQLNRRGYRAAFRREFALLPRRFGDMATCIVDRTESGYFAAGGHLVTAYTTKGINDPFDPQTSTCLTDLSTTTITPQQANAGTVGATQHCRLVRVDVSAPPPAPSAPTTPGAITPGATPTTPSPVAPNPPVQESE